MSFVNGPQELVFVFIYGQTKQIQNILTRSAMGALCVWTIVGQFDILRYAIIIPKTSNGMTNIYVILLVLKILGPFFGLRLRHSFILLMHCDAIINGFLWFCSAIRDHFRFYVIFLRVNIIRIKSKNVSTSHFKQQF